MLPAYAGMIPHRDTFRTRLRGAPRVCGDDPGTDPEGERGREVLPAYAGMIRSAPLAGCPRTGAPRVCGDDPDRRRAGAAFYGCSPRMRG